MNISVFTKFRWQRFTGGWLAWSIWTLCTLRPDESRICWQMPLIIKYEYSPGSYYSLSVVPQPSAAACGNSQESYLPDIWSWTFYSAPETTLTFRHPALIYTATSTENKFHLNERNLQHEGPVRLYICAPQQLHSNESLFPGGGQMRQLGWEGG